MRKISIVTICKNSEKYIGQTLKSVSSQYKNYPEIEHVIVDGNSSDKTLPIIEEYKKSALFPVVLISGADRGISDAMNIGVENATGDFINHLHSDDIFASDNVVNQVIIFLDSHRTCKWCYGDLEVINEESNVINKLFAKPFSLKKLYRCNTIPHPTVFIQRELFVKVGGFDVGLKGAMDYDFFIRLAENSVPEYLGVTVSKFRVHQGSYSFVNEKKVLKEVLKIREKYAKIKYLAKVLNKIIFLKRSIGIVLKGNTYLRINKNM